MNDQQKIKRLELHIVEWSNVRYDAEINAAVAKTLDDMPMLESAKKQLARALKAIDRLTEMVNDLETES